MTETIETPGIVFGVDSDPAAREYLRRLMQDIGRPVQSFRTGEEFLDAYDSDSPGCLVLEVRLPRISGIELQRQLATSRNLIPLIFTTSYGTVPIACEAMRRGAIDVLQKPIEPQLLLDRIEEAMAQDSEARRGKAEREAIEALIRLLTPREREVVNLAIGGMNNTAIAHRLCVSSQAIDSHRARAMRKIGVRNIPELVQFMLKVAAD